MSTLSAILGVDEAGRGPVVGDMFVACVCIDSSDVGKLVALGVRDSKALDRRRREELFPRILEVAKVVVVARATPREIDSTNLNKLFLDKVVEVVKRALSMYRVGRAEVFIDSAGDPSRVSRAVEASLKGLAKEIRVVAEHGADSRYPVVGAASIVAKVLRDWHIDSLKAIYGDFGSGYPSDPRTREWLERVAREGSIPPIVRKSWATVRKLLSKTLLDYLG